MVETKTTFCRICEVCCGLEVDVADGHVTDIRPDRKHVATNGYACIKGIRYKEIHESPDRLKYPLKRVGDRFERISWEQALREIGAETRRLVGDHGPDSIAAYIGNPVAFSTTHPVFMNAFLKGIGTRNVYSAGSQDCNNKFYVAQQMYGSPAIQPIPDFDRTGCFICIGSNPAVSHSSFVQFPRPVERLRDIERRGGTVWLVNPRRTETAQLVGRHVFIRPDTDVFFLLAFLHELIATGGIEHERVERYMKGFEVLEELAAAWSPERVAEVTGIDAATVREMVASYRKARHEDGRGGVLYCSTGLNQSAHGTLAFWLLNVINAVSGNLDAAGGALVGRGLVDVPRALKALGVGESKERSRIGGYEAVMDTFPLGVFPDEVLTPGPGRIRGMFVSAGNPLLSGPGEERMSQALRDLDLLVCVDMFRNETANYAHYVLPGASFLERADLPLAIHGFAPKPYVQYTDAVVAPDGEQKEEWWIYHELCRASGVPAFGSRVASAALSLGRAAGKIPRLGRRLGLSAEGILGAMLATSGKTTLRKLRRNPHGVELGPNRPGDFLGRRVLTDDGKVDLAPSALVREAPDLLQRAFRDERRDDGRLKLIAKREKHSHNSWMHNAPSLVSHGRHTNYLHIHPRDAEERGLADGASARIEGRQGSIVAPVKTTEEMMPGTVALPHGWGHAQADGLRVAQRAAGVNVNRVAPSGPEALERFTGMAHLNGIPVRVMPAAGAAAGDHAAE